MLGATHIEKHWNVASFNAKASRLRQTSPANGRLIAGEIEYESRFPPWIRNSRLVFKMVCRCFQIWQEKGLDGAQPNLCAVPSPLNCETPHGRSQFLMNSMLLWFLFCKYHFTLKCCCTFCWLQRVLSMQNSLMPPPPRKHACDFSFLGIVRISFPLTSNPSTSGKPSRWTSNQLSVSRPIQEAFWKDQRLRD